MQKLIKRKSLLAVLFLVIMFFQIGTAVVFHAASASAANTTAAQDLRARKLFSLNECLSLINDYSRGNKVTSYRGLLTNDNNNYTGGDQLIVVGRDRDSGNGVATCESVLSEGIKEFAPGTSDTNSWLLNKLTGSPNFNSSSSLTVSGAKIDQLMSDVRGAIAVIDVPSDDLQRARFLPLVKVCYNIKNAADTTGFAFKDNGSGSDMFYYQKSDDDIRTFIDQKLHIDKNSGFVNGGNARLGDINLGFVWSSGIGDSHFNGFGDGGTNGSDFYPVGGDLGRTQGYTKDGAGSSSIIDCGWVKKNHEWLLAGLADPANTLPNAGNTTDSTNQADNSCEAKAAELGWIMCPVVKLIDGALNWVDTQIQALLEIDKTSYTDNNLHSAWGQIRNIAYIILIPIMLVMVIGTALGFSFIDAYTVKRALPRMVIAIIFIALSWEVTTFLIGFSNVVGGGVIGILTAPFKSSPPIAQLTLSELYQGNILTGIITGAAFVPAVIIFLWLFGGTLLLFAGLAFIVLLLRQLFIIALVLVAPLAILAWIFPGNDKIWKDWWSAFSKLLVMFPLIMAIIAVGRIFAFIIHNQGAGGAGLQGAIINPLAILAVWILPYAFIPFTFKFAGGVFANLSGMVNDRSKGMFDRLKQNRAQKGQNTLAEHAFKPNSRLGRTLNRPMQTAALAMTGKAGLNPLRARGRLNSYRGVLAGTETGELLDKDQNIAAVKNDDHLAAAVQLGHSRGEIEHMLLATGRYGQQGSRDLSQAVSLVERAQNAGSRTAVNGAMAVARANSGTGYDTEADMFESIVQAAGGNRSLEGQLLAAARSGSERARRPDLAGAGHVAQAEAMNELRGTMGDPGGAAHQAAREHVNSEMRRVAFRNLGAHAIVSGRTEAVTSTVQQLGADFDAAMAAGDVNEAVELGSQITSVRGAMGSASPDVRQQIVAMLDHVGVRADAINPATGQAFSTDDQLGTLIGQRTGRDNQAVTQEIRTRAGAYDVGGGNLTPEQMDARRRSQPPDVT
jgi:hypothetical protein